MQDAFVSIRGHIVKKKEHFSKLLRDEQYKLNNK